MSYGIDYGLGSTNTDKETGIRYGVIPMNRLHEYAWDDMEADYGPPTCPKCGQDAVDLDTCDSDERDSYASYSEYEGCADYACDACEIYFGSDFAFSEEALGHDLTGDGYEGRVGSDGIDLFVTKSPYYTHAEFCSPCAPGACYLLNPVDKNGPRAYCLGHDWFEKNKAPYPIWRVKDDSFVKPGEE